ncbi:inositol-trisphosphate 3-kinase A [Melanotaenia boesemani]|uniref:inositol-trisphosphate 3-kinase A n=1 Tax=Melanotaenia boesemani TaxID=1250792 RepID=UPI001C04BE6B|nr:inositol-trisphosphate 3-kinase A [Melanotaenia boesemani]
MEQNHHLRSTWDKNMDTADEIHMNRMEMETGDTDPCTRLSDETHQHLSISEKPSNSFTWGRRRFRPKLQTTKSFPPYSQSFGGLGEDGELNSDSVITCQANVKEDVCEETQGTEKKAHLTARCSKEIMKAKWRSRRKERLWGSFEVGTDSCDRGRWSGKRGVEESGKEKEHGVKVREGEANSEGKCWRGESSSYEKGADEDDRKKAPTSAVQGENSSSMETTKGKDEEADGMMEGLTYRHPNLSRLVHSSTSSCSSVSFSSAESDEVFSEGEDAASKRKSFRKSCSWKTYLTMMHWSLRRQSSWVQLAGHQGNFQMSKVGEVLKLYSEPEAKCLDRLMRDPLKPFVPQYHGLVNRGEHCYIRLEDLLSGLRRPVIMDCKMGVRTYQEEELTKARTKGTVRSDMYQKMVKIDPSAPSAQEHIQKGVTKWRYLQWKDATSSTSTLGFRIEGIMMEDGNVQRDFGKIQTLPQVTEALLHFTRSHIDTLKAYHSRLLALRDALKHSQFFRTHEVIGSSLLFVHDHSKASVWMIDFGKTTPLSEMKELQHSIPWTEGSREDGYLIGLISLITALSQAIDVASGQQEDSCQDMEDNMAALML